MGLMMMLLAASRKAWKLLGGGCLQVGSSAYRLSGGTTDPLSIQAV